MFISNRNDKSLVGSIIIMLCISSCLSETDSHEWKEPKESRETYATDSVSLRKPLELTSLRIHKDGDAESVTAKYMQLECCFERDTFVLTSGNSVLHRAIVSTDHVTSTSDGVKIRRTLKTFAIRINSFRSEFLWPQGYSLCYVRTDSSVLHLEFTNTLRRYR